MSAISDLKDTVVTLEAKVDAQASTLDVVTTNLTGIGQDITFLKEKLAGLPDGATATEVAEVSALVGNVSAKFDAMGEKITALSAATKELDDSTDSSGTNP